MKMLVVDDSSMIRKAIRGYLAPYEVECVDAENGQVAVEKALADPEIKLVLLDWNMPVMNGHDALVAIRAKRDSDDIKVIMQTTENEMTQVIKALSAGADEYLMKPFDEEMLLDKVSLTIGQELPRKAGA